MSCCSRRALLTAAGLGASAAALTACGGGEQDQQQPRDWVSLTLDEPLEVGASTSAAHQDQPLLLHRLDETQVLAFSAVCPHQGCTVAVAQQGFECPCHGSLFDSAGQWQSGPAEQPLTQYEAEMDGETAVRVLL